MIAKSDTDISAVMGLLGKYNIIAAYIVPTATGMKKSIMDATAPIRQFLKENQIHDFDTQLQGESNKVLISATLILGNVVVPTRVSLYRPETKNGDPRIWIYSLGQYVVPHNLLALIAYEGHLYIVNASDNASLATIEDSQSPLGQIAARLSHTISAIAAELLEMLRERTGDKFIRSIRAGDTGIGATLEHVLGIRTNNMTTPDYKGIEIKASRQSPGRANAKNRVNLFSQVPDWESSPYKKAINLLRDVGYLNDDGRLQLYCSVDAIKPNSQGLVLTINDAKQLLEAIQIQGDEEKGLLVWQLSKLRDRLQEKHPESFWVKADTTMIDDHEHFKYYKVIHTVRPIVSNLDYLLGDGTVSLDLTMSEKGANGVRDHGYLFKMWPKDFSSLFPPPLEHDLY